jgi:TetR/AcrR family transcriptional regulator, repressor of fatR-cypB operon
MSPRTATTGAAVEDDKRERILDAALRIFARSGVDGTPVPPIAKEAGVGVGTLYHYFESKDAIVNAVFRRTKRQLQEHLLSDLPSLEPSRALFDLVWDRMADFATQEPDAFRFLEMQDHAPYLDDTSRKEESKLLGPLRALVEQGQRAGLFSRDIRPEIALALFWGSVVGLFKSERLGYLKIRKSDLFAAREACWRMMAKEE